MKGLRRFLVVFIFLLLGACAFRSFAIYNSFIRHPDLYATDSTPWYWSIMVTVVITLALIAIPAILCCVIGYRLKKQKNKPNEKTDK